MKLNYIVVFILIMFLTGCTWMNMFKTASPEEWGDIIAEAERLQEEKSKAEQEENESKKGEEE